jgi:N-acyl-D-aspartate/D-glutamate deacylase
MPIRTNWPSYAGWSNGTEPCIPLICVITNSRVLEAVEEALELGRRAGVRVELSHLQVAGHRNWYMQDMILSHIEEAWRQGVDVGMDAYPYVAGSCDLTQILPTWALAGGTAALLKRLQARKHTGGSARKLMAAWQIPGRYCDRLGGERELRPDREKHPGSGLRAKLPGCGSGTCAARGDRGRVHIISFNQSDENLSKVPTHPLTVIITDGLWTEGKPHPRTWTFGTYPLFLGHYVRELGWMSFSEAVLKVTALPARRFHLRDRGEIRSGGFADLTIFDQDNIGTSSSYLEPDGLHRALRTWWKLGRAEWWVAGRVDRQSLRHNRA